MTNRYAEFQKGDELFLDGDLHVVQGWTSDGRLHLEQPSIGMARFLDEAEFQRLLSTGLLRLRRDLVTSTALPFDDQRMVAAAAMLAVVESFDAEHVSGEHGAIEKTIARCRSIHDGATAGRPSLTASRLRRALAKGARGGRRVEDYIDCRGLAPRVSFTPAVNQIVATVVDYFWGVERPRHIDAWARFQKLKAEYLDKYDPKRTSGLKWPRETALRNAINAAETQDRYAARHGKRAAAYRFRGRHPSVRAAHALHRVQIDHTTADIHVVDGTTGKLLGRPTLTLVIDEWSGAILAVVVTMLAPSLLVAIEALRRAILPPTEGFQEKHGLLEPWIYWGAPDWVIKDRGTEFGASLENCLATARVSTERARRKSPKDKPHVESRLRPISGIFRSLPGGIPYDIATLRELYIDPKKEAALTIEELETICWRYAEHVNRFSDRRDDRQTPKERWLDSLSRKPRKVIDPEVIDAFGFSSTRVLDTSGISVDGMKYHDPDAVTRLLDSMAHKCPKRSARKGVAGSAKVKVRISQPPADARYIHVWDSERECLERLENTEHRWWGRDIEWCEKVRAFERAERSGQDEDRTESLLNLEAAKDKARDKATLLRPEKRFRTKPKSPDLLPVDGVEIVVADTPSPPRRTRPSNAESKTANPEPSYRRPASPRLSEDMRASARASASRATTQRRIR